MRRRQFLGLLGGAAIGLPKAVAQKPLPRVGFLASGAAASINSAALVATLKHGLEDIAELKASQEEIKRVLARVSEQSLSKASPPPTQPTQTLRKPERTVQPPRARARPPREWIDDEW